MKFFQSRKKNYKNKGARAPNFSLPSNAHALIDYWLDSLRMNARMEALARMSRGSWIKISEEELSNSRISNSAWLSLKEREEKEQDSKVNIKHDYINTVISPLRLRNLKIRRKYHDLILIPALISKDGKIHPSHDTPPWIPREFLDPSLDPSVPTIASFIKSETYFKKNPFREFSNFESYLSYSEDYFYHSTKMNFSDFMLQGYEKEDEVYVGIYEPLSPGVRAVMRVLEEVKKGRRNIGVFKKILQERKSIRKLYPRSKYSLYSASSKHLAHSSSKYPLSFSQRKSLHRFFQTPEGEVFCINGPPGTGKTFVLQNIIISSWVLYATLNKPSPPVLVVCGATNQSVLNVLNSFEVDEAEKSIIERRWIPEVFSYGVFCASYSKAEKADSYLIEQTNGEGLSEYVEREEFLHDAESYFLSCYKKTFNEVGSLSRARAQLMKMIKEEVSSLRKSCISALQVSLTDFLKSGFNVLDKKEERSLIEKLSSFDTTRRYRLFLLASHYWEASWIIETSKELKERKKNKDTANRFRSSAKDWQRRAMLTPVFVSTVSMAGRYFGTRENMIEPPIDVLFYDEAGQLNPEQGAAISALGKKLVSIGDTAQLEPYSSIPPHVDEARMRDSGLIRKNEEGAFSRIVKRGLSASSNSFMELAIQACDREDGAIIGGYLLEHRRSVPEIISYCNELSYRGRLSPDRPSLKRRILPPFSLIEVRGESMRVGVSLKNRVEARAISTWLKANENKIKEFYSKEKIEDILAIITPFTAQAEELKSLLSSTYPQLIIGTVHSLQGAERDIILFSSVYDELHKGENALDRDSRILNVAVSRARDSFIVFGAKSSFTAKTSEILPSTLLGKYLFSTP